MSNVIAVFEMVDVGEKEDFLPTKVLRTISEFNGPIRIMDFWVKETGFGLYQEEELNNEIMFGLHLWSAYEAQKEILLRVQFGTKRLLKKIIVSPSESKHHFFVTNLPDGRFSAMISLLTREGGFLAHKKRAGSFEFRNGRFLTFLT